MRETFRAFDRLAFPLRMLRADINLFRHGTAVHDLGTLELLRAFLAFLESMSADVAPQSVAHARVSPISQAAVSGTASLTDAATSTGASSATSSDSSSTGTVRDTV